MALNIRIYYNTIIDTDVAKDFFLVSHFHKFHQKGSVILGYFNHKKNKMLSVILKKVQFMTE